MEYRVLGPLEVLDESGQKVSLGGARQQSVLASLLLRAGHTVALDRLVDELWDEPPTTAARTVQAYVSRLRRKLPEGAIARRAGGYAVLLDADDLDLTTFERQAEDGRAALAAADYERSAALLGRALALWRGPALGGLTSDALRREADRLEEQRLVVLEDRIDADLGAGRHVETVAELSALVSEHPFRERLRAQLMTALYRSGRPSEALAAYRDARRLLVDELAMEPGQELRELEQAILRQDAELDAPKTRRSGAGASSPAPDSAPHTVASPPRELRKTVTVLFCDLVGSTAQGESTDPEVMRALLARYFERMKEIVEHHGGTVEKFIGDAVMAVFGVPLAHEDDALRSCRAALEMRESFARLGVEGRLGIATGEVVTGTEERLATGDAVNVAARLEQVAESGHVLLDAATLQLVGAAADVEALPPLALKGKANPVAAYRLGAVREPHERLHDTRFVGRESEVELLRTKWESVLAQGCCELFTIVGEAGVGKSRLVEEALRNVDGRVVRGRCLPYGDGITYWPVVEVIKALDTIPSEPAAAAAIGSLVGDSRARSTAEEIAWGFRRLLEEQAPLIVVFDDIQQGEETFLDLVEHAALLSTSASVLIVCLARPELRQLRPEWPIAMQLEPLREPDVKELIPARLKNEIRGRIRRACGGNPLFITEIVAMALETEGAVVVPPTLRALLGARLDQLDDGERLVLERAAIEGEVFHRSAVQTLSDGQSVTPRLASLVRKGLIERDAGQIRGEDAFRFRHLLIRDAAYETVPKAVRADLHERFANWLEEHSEDSLEEEEILGHHLERAFRYRTELWPRDERTERLGLRACDLLSSAGERAVGRNDVGASLKLLKRALALLPEDDPAVPLRLSLTEALFLSGDFAAAGELANDIATSAARDGNQPAELRARLAAARIAAQMSDDDAAEEPSAALLTLAERAKPVFTRVGDEVGLTDAWVAIAWAQLVRSRWGAMLDAVEHALVHARRAGYIRWQRELPVWKGTALFYGPTPVDEVLRWYGEERPQHTMALSEHAVLEAMRGRFDEARSLLGSVDSAAEERGETLWRAGGWMAAWEVETLAGDATAAEVAARKTCALLKKLGDTGFRSLAAGQLASSLFALERFDESMRWTRTAEKLASSDDVTSNMLWRQARARLLARDGRHDEAQRFARDAVRLGERTDMLNWHASALVDMGTVSALAGRLEAARDQLEHALALYEQKGNLVAASNTRAALDGLGSTGPVVTQSTKE